jgi:hypothetical protein
MKSTKTNFKKKHNKNSKKKRKKKENKTLWITIIIHSAIYVGEQWFPHTL